MIVRQGGGNSGIAEYLEKGAKFDRHYSRDELDRRIIIDGDLDITDAIINSIQNKDQERYLHITLSFNEPEVTVEKMQSVYEDYKKILLSAYQSDEINTYAEIHWPKTQQLLDKTTGKMYDRYPHIHMVIPKQNLLTGRYANPTGLYERNINIWGAIQEDVNNRHGLKSPAHNPRISIENYKAVLARHKVGQFKGSFGETKKNIFDAVDSRNIRTWDDFKKLVSEYGDLNIRNEGLESEYLAVKIPGNSRFTNLRNPIFSKEYIEHRVLPREPLTHYQISNRLKQWELISRELKYIEDAGSVIKKQYRAMDKDGREKFLKQREAKFYARYEVSEPERKERTFRSGDFKSGREAKTDKRSLYGLPPRHLVHDRDGRRTARRTDLFLSADESVVLQFIETNGNDGLHGTLHSETGIMENKESIKSVTGQIVFDHEERRVIAKNNELEHFREIRRNLNPEAVLAYAQAHYLINPEKHKSSKAKDGSARINFGVNNYNVSDFFTKGLGLTWEETKPILLSLYEAQLNKEHPRPVSNDTIKNMLVKFEDSEYPFKIDLHKLEMEKLKKREREALHRINEQYRYNVSLIYAKVSSYAERNKRRALEAFFKLVLEEELKVEINAERERINQLKYPFSEHFKSYLAQEQVMDMSIIDELKERFGYKATEREEQNGFASGRPFEMLNGREASRRAKLMAELAAQGKPHTKYGYSFKDLRPEQKKESVVFYHDFEKLFEAKADKVLVLGKPDVDKTATALAYSLQRFGNPLDITGSNAFKEQVVDVAARSGLEVTFTDPVLNDALARRLAELGLEGKDQENSISAESLELDTNLEASVAVDQALRESKEREIQIDLMNPTTEMKELAALSILQRRNVHESEPVTAETAELDAALLNGLANTPAMQAYFATDMAKLAQGNEKYRQALVEAGVASEVMLASHAAVTFRDALESAYESNRKMAGILPEDWDNEAEELETTENPFAEPTDADQGEILSEDEPQEQSPSPVTDELETADATDTGQAPELPEDGQQNPLSGMEAEDFESTDDPFAEPSDADQGEILSEDEPQEQRSDPVTDELETTDEPFAEAKGADQDVAVPDGGQAEVALSPVDAVIEEIYGRYENSIIKKGNLGQKIHCMECELKTYSENERNLESNWSNLAGQRNYYNHRRSEAESADLNKEIDDLNKEIERNEKNLSIVKAQKEKAQMILSALEVKQMFSLEPDTQLYAGNLAAKAAVNEIKAIKSPVQEEEIKQTAKTIVAKLNEIRNSKSESGRAEIRNAAMAVTELCSTDSALADEVVSVCDAESRLWMAEVLAQGKELNINSPIQEQQVLEPDMSL